MFSPMTAATNIKDGFIDYITTSFHFADSTYEEAFTHALEEEGAVARGPYLDIGGSYETGKTLNQLIDDGAASVLFKKLENSPEANKELKLMRPLYLHQEAALKTANAGKSMIVTTGTGSGKTECFLIPIINHLLKKLERDELEDAVCAIIIYPMNALANDQMKRMRALLKDAKAIRFGLYNGNTKHTRKDALTDYHHAHNGEDPLENEAISREEMQERPPHILITNYSMMEYMLLRPKDDAVFQNAQLKFIVLDEAHIYRGATGMETSMLLRRMHARIAHKDQLQYILTSATLGDPEADAQIIDFGNRLCGISFDETCIIRSKLKQYEKKSSNDYPMKLFVDLARKQNDISAVLARYGVSFRPEINDEEKLFNLCLDSKLYDVFRSIATGPMTLPMLLSGINQFLPITAEELESFIEVCRRASKDGANLIRPRYHFFIRALEGAYITVGDYKRLSLNRCSSVIIDGKTCVAFEAAVCTDCGRVALTGTPDLDGKLTQQSTKGDAVDTDYYLIRYPEDSVWFLDDDEDDTSSEMEYIACSICGAMRNDNGSQNYPCDHGSQAYIRLHKAKNTSSGICRCPACGTGVLRRFYLGSEAATAVLGTDLYEQLPDEEIIETVTAQKASNSIFGTRRPSRTIKQDRIRQFLCFSDSRSEAAYFASYMEQSYEEFLRRRGIWHTAEKLRQEGRMRVSMNEFIRNLTTYFESNRSFVEWDSKENSAFTTSKTNAWTAMLNEMYNARRATGLMAMGVFSVRYRRNEGIAEAMPNRYGLTEPEMHALLEMIVMDGVYTGAIDAGSNVNLSDAQREYIFFASTPQKLVKVKNAGESKRTSEHGWCARSRSNGSYYPNVKISRLCQALHISENEANSFLADYWDNILAPERNTFVFDANDFDVLLEDFDSLPIYRCKKCGRVTSLNIQGKCANVKCTGTLEPYDAMKASEKNHYARLYRSEQMKPLYIKEHTAQLSKAQQSRYQEAFVKKQINALSCSTTFEMGVDVGSLETVYMRNVPPSPANYVQRAGRAGRGRNAAAFVLTYAKLSSHDFTYFNHPENMISGDIAAPVFRLENEKIIRRHIFAVVLGYFFKRNPEAYDHDDRAAFLLEGGYERLKAMLDPVPDELAKLLKASIPASMHSYMGITDGTWVEKMVGTGDVDSKKEPGILETVYQGFHNEINELERLRDRYHRNHEPGSENRVAQQLRMTRAGKDDNVRPKSLIDFLVRNNILPKYGFPVDTVELHQYGSNSVEDEKQLQLSRDLQMAIAEYAPGSEIIADGKLYKSRYIRRGAGKAAGSTWENGFYSDCPLCGQRNFTKEFIPKGENRECVSCHKGIPQRKWHITIEPRLGFQAESEGQPVPLHRPERGYKTDDYYIGDPNRNVINRRIFRINGRKVVMESTSNDSLVVISRESYRVCPRCGYADDKFPDTHKNGRGFLCEGESKDAKEYYLSHDFKTDVVKLTFIDGRAKEKNRMYSVMYALLEGLSREMGIERNDIKGCLHSAETEQGLVFSIILYDAVAGGAGNVRRMVTDDGRAFEQVTKKAVELLEQCKCDSSCYNCLRNYYNQKIHDLLNRYDALDFLRDWKGEAESIEEAAMNNLDQNDDVSIECNDNVMKDYANWTELAEIYGSGTTMAQWDAARIPYQGEFLATLKYPAGILETIVLWPEKKLALCENNNLETIAPLEALGWRFLSINEKPEEIVHALNGGN